MGPEILHQQTSALQTSSFNYHSILRLRASELPSQSREEKGVLLYEQTKESCRGQGEGPSGRQVMTRDHQAQVGVCL